VSVRDVPDLREGISVGNGKRKALLCLGVYGKFKIRYISNAVGKRYDVVSVLREASRFGDLFLTVPCGGKSKLLVGGKGDL
jgi:hypothetical protein